MHKFIFVVVIFAMTSIVARADGPSAVRDSLFSSLMFMKGVYRAGYAPTAWKKKFAGWDLDTEINKAISAAQTAPKLQVKDAQQIAKTFINSMKDYHVSISFQSTETASLPFTVKGVKDKFFLAYIDRAKLSADSFPFKVGDELVTFADMPAAQAVALVQKEGGDNVEATDRALAEITLTSRRASRGYLVPHGPVNLGIKPNGLNVVRNIQLIWDYTPEKIKDPYSFPGTMLGFAFDDIDPKPAKSSSLFKPMMVVDFEAAAPENPYMLGARKTFTPALGQKIWESDSADSPFHAYVYKAPDRRFIGYVRIPSYTPGDSRKAEAEFAKIISMFEVATDAMVIDQVNNPGGSVFYLYTLVSMLSDQPLATPQHRMAISQTDVMEAYKILPKLESIKDDEQAKKLLGDALDGYPASYEVAQFMLNYARFLIDEFNSGRTLSRPYWIEGVDRINPAPIHYTKPILVLTNGLDFSGGDFFPAILQDNKRVTIFGTRTAGAGGYVNDVPYPNDLGIVSFRITGSIAERADKNPIENLGVKPDIEYQISESDLTNGYADYAKAIQQAVLSLVK